MGEGYTLPIILHCNLWSWEAYFHAYWHERTTLGAAWFPTYDARSKTLLQNKPLTRDAVGRVLNNRINEAQRAGALPTSSVFDNLASHSLRRGGATYM